MARSKAECAQITFEVIAPMVAAQMVYAQGYPKDLITRTAESKVTYRELQRAGFAGAAFVLGEDYRKELQTKGVTLSELQQHGFVDESGTMMVDQVLAERENYKGTGEVRSKP